jgi:hypothetical protein
MVPKVLPDGTFDSFNWETNSFRYGGVGWWWWCWPMGTPYPKGTATVMEGGGGGGTQFQSHGCW